LFDVRICVLAKRELGVKPLDFGGMLVLRSLGISSVPARAPNGKNSYLALPTFTYLSIKKIKYRQAVA
jgi:hypothetical protein